MKTCQHCRAAIARVQIIKVVLILLTPMVLSSAAVAGDRSQEDTASAGGESIQIVADKLITNDGEKFAEFTGNVRASQGTFVMTAERLRIYYQTVPASAGQQAAGQESIKQVVASENVHVDTDKYTAKSDRLEYDLETQVIVLIGENSTLTRKKNILTGSKITIDRKTGQMKVESQPQQQVKAVFYPNQDKEKKE